LQRLHQARMYSDIAATMGFGCTPEIPADKKTPA
jgi:hypothetical protein